MLVVSAILHPFRLNLNFGTLVDDICSFPFDNETYLTLSDAQAGNIWYSEFDKIR